MESQNTMDLATVKHLVQLNNDFYAQHFASFSSTREKPWAGWERGLKHLQGLTDPSIADFAAGNLRFERYLLELGVATPSKMYAFDGCADLMCRAADELGVNAFDVDIISKLIANEPVSKLPPVDLACSFGFMHHIPSADLRRRFLDLLIASAKPGGFVFVSLWEFASSSLDVSTRQKRDEAKAKVYTDQYLSENEAIARTLKLEDDDYLLGWKNLPNSYRYCHNFSAREVDQIVSDIGSKVLKVARFKADGKENDSNHYLILQRLAHV